ncbi:MULTISPECIES: DNA-binding protein [Paraburkholderia]|uniref:DNA-binding protein n=1 Tax=Paraburkholderia podalyriae TaxID=1938811 RepID=A0ABR7PFY3_9BURK|nr:DNA-binding protein [Paraburkholderia podalyriae]MBC8745211.1 DNA-binding protein [Paraburkholderia podalyriae]
MKEQQPEVLPTPTHVRQFLTTDELAERLNVRPRSIHKRYSQTGAYFSVRPIKLPNRRLWWPIDTVEQLTGAAA